MEKKVFSSPEKTRHLRNGKTITIPAYQEVYYFVGGKRIAWVDKEGILYLRTGFIKSKKLSDFKLPYSERIVGSQFEAEYRELLNEYAKVSEFTEM